MRQNSIIQIGHNGPEVQWLKQQLNALGIQPETSNSNSNFGPITLKQVKAFQEAFGINSDGVVGVRTLIAINSSLKHKNTPTLDKE